MQGTLGTVQLFAGNFAPRNWAFCDGQLLNVSSFTALFSLLGSTYGGDGRTTFALPDLRGRVAVGEGQSPGLSRYRLGQRGGAEQASVSVNQLGSHTHPVSVGTTLPAFNGPANQHEPGTGRVLAQPTAQGATGLTMYQATEAADVDLQTDGAGSLALGDTGGGQTHENRQEVLALRYIICIVGLFPSRN